MTVCPPTLINGRWWLNLPAHRAERAEWAIENGGWEPERLADMAEHLGPGDVVYDVGSEQGDLPALWASWGCEVVLVEPNPLAWPNIACVWAANFLPPPLAWWVGFASDRCHIPTKATIHFPFGKGTEEGWPPCAAGEPTGATGFAHLAQEADVIPQITLDALALEAGKAPTAITIDVEGSELTVLRGASGILAEHRPIVWVSIHTDRIWMDELYGGVDARDVYALMESFGYVGTHLATDHEEHHRFRHPQGR